MFALFPPITLILLFRLIRNRFPDRDWREALLAALVVVGSGMILSMEFLSLFHKISFFSIRSLWGLALIYLLLANIRIGFPCRVAVFHLREWKLLELLGLVSMAVVVLGTLAGAVCSPPNNWDSMTYHLPRVMQWASSGSLDHFATHIPRQLFNAPGAEMLLLQVYFLSGNDHWFNLVQWVGYVGCIIAGSWVACLLGAGRWGQILAAMGVAFIPMAVLQASSTQNDLVMSLWVICFVAFGLSAIFHSYPGCFLLSAASLGLAVLTKTSVFVTGLFFIWFGMVFWLRYKRVFFLSIMLFLSICGPHYYRNWSLLDGRSFLHEEGLALIMQKHDIYSVISNGIRQTASEMRTLWRPANDFLVEIVKSWHAFSGVKIDDAGIFSDSLSVINTAPLAMDEDYAGNTLHVFLFAFLLLSVIIGRPRKVVLGYVICLCCSCLLFWLMLKWQPWINRLHLPVMVLVAPLLGVVADKYRKILGVFVCLLFVFAVWAMLFNATRPLIGGYNVFGSRLPVTFAKNRYLIPYYSLVSVLIEKAECRDVGLIEKEDSWEYPLWSMTHGKAVKFSHVQVSNVSKKFERPDPPCALVAIDQAESPRLRVVKSVPYVRVWGAEKVMDFYIRIRPEMLKRDYE